MKKELVMNLNRLDLLLAQALYRGLGHISEPHRHHAVQIGISFDAPIKLRRSSHEPWQEVKGFVVAPNAVHQIDSADQRCAFVWSETVRTKLDFDWRVTTPGEHEALYKLLNDASLFGDPKGVVQRVLELTQTDPDTHLLDKRVEQVKHWLTTDFSREDLATFAARVHLSPSRLRHLFQATTGISMQRYALWQKTMRAIRLASESSVTDGSLDAGFSDSSHFSRMFRQSFGLTYSSVSRSVQVRTWVRELGFEE